MARKRALLLGRDRLTHDERHRLAELWHDLSSLAPIPSIIDKNGCEQLCDPTLDERGCGAWGCARASALRELLMDLSKRNVAHADEALNCLYMLTPEDAGPHITRLLGGR